MNFPYCPLEEDKIIFKFFKSCQTETLEPNIDYTEAFESICELKDQKIEILSRKEFKFFQKENINTKDSCKNFNSPIKDIKSLSLGKNSVVVVLTERFVWILYLNDKNENLGYKQIEINCEEELEEEDNYLNSSLLEKIGQNLEDKNFRRKKAINYKDNQNLEIFALEESIFICWTNSDYQIFCIELFSNFSFNTNILKGHFNKITKIKWYKENFLISSSLDNILILWDVRSASQVYRWVAITSNVCSVLSFVICF